MSDATPDSPPTRRRLRFAVRLRTMLLIVLVVAAGLGYLDYRKRRAAVDDLLAQLSIRVFVSIGPTSPFHSPVHDPGGTYAAATKRVRQLHVEHWAVADLVAILHRARLAQDETKMRGALAALEDLGPAITAAKPEVLRVARGEGLTEGPPEQFVLVRGQAIHVLGRIAKEDEAVIGDLIGTLSLPDPTGHRHLIACSANEIAAFGPKAGAATAPLLRLLEAASSVPADLGPASIVGALGAIGPAAREALPTLQRLARDRARSADLRVGAIRAIAPILASRPKNRWERGFDPSLEPFLAEFADDPDPQVQAAVAFYQTQIRWQAEAKQRHENILALIAADRARGGQPRPATPAK